jgi:hypothetical protein
MDEREAARLALAKGDATPALEFNRRVQEQAGETCGGCIGAGTGARCCMCGKPRA